jgi:hypothetical protein
MVTLTLILLSLKTSLNPRMTDQEKIATLLAHIDNPSFQIFQYKAIPQADKQVYSCFIIHIRERLGSRENEQELRLNFRETKQHHSESFDDLYTKLVRLSVRTFPGQPPEILDTHIRDHLIQGCYNGDIKLKLIEAASADSQHALALAKRYHAAHMYARRVGGSEFSQQSRSSAIRGRPGQVQRSLTSRMSDGRPICFNCRTPGHVAAHFRRAPSSDHVAYHSQGYRRPFFN